jgi:hypothetical protein
MASGGHHHQQPLGLAGTHRAVSPSFASDERFFSCGSDGALADDVDTWR